MATDPTGKSFLSYRRSRAQEAALLITAQHLHGIPTWQDIDDLDTGPTESYIREVLNDPTTANALVWITPDVANSAFIQKIEVPLILSRVETDESFFAIPVAAGGLDFAAAAAALGPHAAFHHVRGWNLMRADSDPIDQPFAAKLAFQTLRRRLREIHRHLLPDQPLLLRLSTRVPESFQSGTALVLNWHAQFTNREAPAPVWEQQLYPALRNVGTALWQEARGRPIEASGNSSLVAALAMGVVFLAPRNVAIGWRQVIPGQSEQLWSLQCQRSTSQLEAFLTPRDLDSSALAVAVAVARRRNEVRDDFITSLRSLPPFRALLELAKPDGGRYDLPSPEEARDAAHAVVDAIQRVKSDLGGIHSVHLFLAVPTGLAMLIGQLLNGLPEVQLYEHVPGADPGPYRPALKLNPSL